ncbi:MAG: histidine phosphatase family protein [Promethearchaeota archaeon]
MNYKLIWEEAAWTEEARNLIKGLNKFPQDSKIILIIRHSHRKSINTQSEMAEMRLTPLGHEIAELFASKLPANKSIRVFYSPFQRCKETALDLLKGFRQISGQGTLKRDLKELYDIGVSPDFFFKEITKYPQIQFLYRWVADLYSSENVIPFKNYCQNALEIILEENIDSPKNSIDIHVTHDLVILAYRLGWFGLSPDGKWPSFLGGFAFTMNEDHILLLDTDKLRTIEIPYWWNSPNDK